MLKIDVDRLPKLKKKEFPTIKQTVTKKIQQKPIIVGGSVASYMPVNPKSPSVDASAIMNKYKNTKVGKVDLPMMGAGSTIPSRLRTPEQKQTDDLRQAKAMSNSKLARFAYGAGEGLHPLGHEKKTEVQKDIKTLIDNTTAGKAGKLTGQVGQFAIGYGLGAAPITAGLKGIQAFNKLGKLGQGIARSATTDLAVGLPLNANIAYNKEGLRGEDALKNIALNTGIDLVAGGALEVLGGIILKNGRKVATKSDFDDLTVPEKEETILMLQAPEVETKLLAEGVNWRAPNQPDYYVNRGGAASPSMANVRVAGELPAPAQINPVFNPKRRTLSDPYKEFNNEYEKSVESVAKYIRDYKGKGAQTGIMPKDGDELMRDGGIRFAQSNNDLWYQDFFKAHGRKPNKSEAEEIARELVDEGLMYRNGEFSDEDLYLLLQDARYRKTTLPRIDKDIPKVVKPPEIPNPNRETPYTVNSGEMVSPVDSVKRRIRGEAPVKAPDAPVQASKTEVGADVPQSAKQAENKAGTRAAIKVLEEEIEKQKLYNTQLYDSIPAPSRADPSNKAAEPILDAWRASSKKLREMADELNKLKGEEVIPNTPDNSKKPFVNSFGEATKREITNASYERAQNKLSKEMMSFVGGKQGQKGKSGRWSIGADTARPEKTVDELVKEHGAIPKGEQPRAREVDIPKATNYGDVQQHARTLQESAIVDDTLFVEINKAIEQGSFTKPSKSNKTAVENADSAIEQHGLDESVNKFRSVLSAEKTPTSEDIALGNRVLQELQKEGRYDDALNVAIDLSQILSETGRTLQAARIAKKLSPEGRLMMATRVAEKVAKKTGNKIKVSDETAKLISDAKTEKEIIEANQKAAKEIWEQAPANWIDKVNAWRYMSMLTNPKTHIRNIVGNALFLPVREFKNLIGAGLESRLLKSGDRTKAVLNLANKDDRELLKFAGGDFKNVKSLLKNEGKLDDNIRNLDAKVFDTKAVEAIRKFNMNALDAEDTWFMKFAYDSSLAQYMKANRIKPADMIGETLEKGRKYAMNEALKATYRDFNSLSNLIARGKSVTASGKYGKFGMAGNIVLEGVVPFSKTPLNIVKRGVAYSPANLVRGIASLNKVKAGKVTATEAIDQLASGLSGTAILGLGTFLGYRNIVSGKEGEYKDKSYNYNQMLGSQNYSLNVDGISYTLDWAAPLSMPFFVGVELSKSIKDNGADLAAVIDSMTKISDPMVNLSMLKGINDIVTNNFEGLGQTAFDIGTGYAGQFNPTVLGQVARTLDDTRRSTVSTAETGTMRGIKKFGRKQIAKLPGASQKLEPYIDMWGREQKSGNIIENFLSPGYFKQENVTRVDRVLKSLAEGLDEETAKKILPTSTAYQYTLKSNGETYRMTEKESTAYQKTRGQESYKELERLFDSAGYKRMTREEKVKAIEKSYSAAAEKAKYNYFDSKGLPVTLAMSGEDQAKYDNLKGIITDKRFYSAASDMRTESTDIAKVYAAEANGKVPDRFYAEFNISPKTVDTARTLKAAGIAADQYTTAREKADTNQSSNISKTEAIAYLNGQKLSRRQKFILLKSLVPTLKDHNNPYR